MRCNYILTNIYEEVGLGRIDSTESCVLEDQRDIK